MAAGSIVRVLDVCHEESISQWQRYGADGSGYCIGFSARDLDKVLEEALVSRTAMLYDEEEQLSTLRMAVANGVEECRRLKAKKSSYLEYVFTDMELDSAMLQMKNPFFRDELEWRYFVRCHEGTTSPHLPKEEFAVRGALIKPLIELPRRKQEPRPRLPISAVVCGPKLDAGLSVPTVSRFMYSKGYTVPVEQSALSEIWR